MITVSLHLSNSLNWLVTQAFRQNTIILKLVNGLILLVCYGLEVFV